MFKVFFTSNSIGSGSYSFTTTTLSLSSIRVSTLTAIIKLLFLKFKRNSLKNDCVVSLFLISRVNSTICSFVNSKDCSLTSVLSGDISCIKKFTC